jgi:hypothetical protein
MDKLLKLLELLNYAVLVLCVLVLTACTLCPFYVACKNSTARLEELEAKKAQPIRAVNAFEQLTNL